MRSCGSWRCSGEMLRQTEVVYRKKTYIYLYIYILILLRQLEQEHEGPSKTHHQFHGAVCGLEGHIHVCPMAGADKQQWIPFQPVPFVRVLASFVRSYRTSGRPATSAGRSATVTSHLLSFSLSLRKCRSHMKPYSLSLAATTRPHITT